MPTDFSLKRYARPLTVLWIVYWVVLCGLTHSPKLPRPPLPLDSRLLIAHFVAFGILALLCVLSAKNRGRETDRRWMVRWFVVFTVYGGLDELLQPLTQRHASVLDWLADVAGVAVVFFLFRARKSRAL